jgi:hypothetical protein
VAFAASTIPDETIPWDVNMPVHAATASRVVPGDTP